MCVGPSKDGSPRRGCPQGERPENSLSTPTRVTVITVVTVVTVSPHLARQTFTPFYGLQGALHRPRVTDGWTRNGALCQGLNFMQQLSVPINHSLRSARTLLRCRVVASGCLKKGKDEWKNFQCVVVFPLSL